MFIINKLGSGSVSIFFRNMDEKIEEIVGRVERSCFKEKKLEVGEEWDRDC